MATITITVNVTDATDFENKGFKKALEALAVNTAAYFDGLAQAGKSSSASVGAYADWALATPTPFSSTDPTTQTHVNATYQDIAEAYRNLASSDTTEWDD